MNGIITSLVEEDEYKERVPEDTNYAIVTGIYPDGLELKRGLHSKPGGKHYRYNGSAQFAVGDRVFVIPSSGSLFVVGPVAPRTVGRGIAVGHQSNQQDP